MISAAVQASVRSISGIWIHDYILPSLISISNNQFIPIDEVIINADISFWLEVHERSP
jgi:hypothetical protein